LNRLKEEKIAMEKLIEEKKWNELTTELHKSYDTSRPKLSTFINVLRELPSESPAKILNSCE
jgi:hypothetical protein